MKATRMSYRSNKPNAILHASALFHSLMCCTHIHPVSICLYLVLALGYGGLLWRRRGCLEFGPLGHHPAESNSNSFDNCQKDGTSNSIIAHGSSSAPNGERTAGKESAENRIPGVFLLSTQLVSYVFLTDVMHSSAPNPLHSTIKC